MKNDVFRNLVNNYDLINGTILDLALTESWHSDLNSDSQPLLVSLDYHLASLIRFALKNRLSSPLLFYWTF